jgi:hypothetical protein
MRSPGPSVDTRDRHGVGVRLAAWQVLKITGVGVVAGDHSRLAGLATDAAALDGDAVVLAVGLGAAMEQGGHPFAWLETDHALGQAVLEGAKRK